MAISCARSDCQRAGFPAHTVRQALTLFPLWPAALAVIGGCASPGPLPLRQSVRQIADVDRATVFLAAEAALVDEGFRISGRDIAAGTITATAMELPPRLDRIASTFRLSSPDRLRRVASVRIDERGGIVQISCRADLQEQVTEAQRMFERQYTGTDRPDDTPIDRGAAATRKQNTYWRTSRRDRGAERRILQAVMAKLGRSAPQAGSVMTEPESD